MYTPVTEHNLKREAVRNPQKLKANNPKGFSGDLYLYCVLRFFCVPFFQRNPVCNCRSGSDIPFFHTALPFPDSCGTFSRWTDKSSPGLIRKNSIKVIFCNKFFPDNLIKAAEKNGNMYSRKIILMGLL